MKRFILTCAIIALITSCKSQQFTAPIAIRDSVSVTYHPGTIQSLTDSSDSTDTAPTCGGAIAVKPPHDGLASQAQKCSSARPLQIPQKVRVDTLIVERWHTQILQPEGRSYSESGPSGEAGLSAKRSQFYKRCTAGFFILLLLIIGRIAFKLIKLIYLRR